MNEFDMRRITKIITVVLLLALSSCSYTQEQINRNPQWFDWSKI